MYGTAHHQPRRNAIVVSIYSVICVRGDSRHSFSGARLKSRRGVNLPGTSVDLPALSNKDKADIIYGIGKVR